MTKRKAGPTINRGGAAKPKTDEAAAAFDIAGNVAAKGGKPSPAARDRGETGGVDTAAPVDLEDVHDRAS